MTRLLLTILISAFLATGASAQFVGPSSSRYEITVSEAQAARRGQTISLEGYIVKHLRDNYYLFRDKTGEMRAKIDRHIWRDRKVTSKTRVRLSGKLDRDFREHYINVRRLDLVK